MNHREGLQRLGVVALIFWESLAGIAFIDAIRDFSAQGPWNKYAGTYQSLAEMISPPLFLMALPLAAYFAARWVLRGFTPPSAANLATSSTLERAEANMRGIAGTETAKIGLH